MRRKIKMNQKFKQTKIKEIFRKLKVREGPNIEYKLCKSKLSKDLWETVSAFSNEGGGFILLGYEEKEGEYMPVGVKKPHKILDDFTSLAGQKFNYWPVINAEILEDDNKPIILIEVKEVPKYLVGTILRICNVPGSIPTAGIVPIIAIPGNIDQGILKRIKRLLPL